MTDILNKIEALLIEEGVISDDKPADLPKAKNIIDIDFAVTRRYKMEFSDNINFKSAYVGLLASQNIDDFYIDTTGASWKYCRYLQNEWLINSNMIDRCSKKILPAGLKVEVMLRNGDIGTGISQVYNFNYSSASSNNTPNSNDIVAYRILGTAEDWKYEWENN